MATRKLPLPFPKTDPKAALKPDPQQLRDQRTKQASEIVHQFVQLRLAELGKKYSSPPPEPDPPAPAALKDLVRRFAKVRQEMKVLTRRITSYGDGKWMVSEYPKPHLIRVRKYPNSDEQRKAHTARLQAVRQLRADTLLELFAARPEDQVRVLAQFRLRLQNL